MSYIHFLFLSFIYFIAIVYFQLAHSFRIFPKHQDQSRRNRIVKGMGIVFPIGWILFMVLNDFVFPLFTLSLVLVSLFAFADDLVSLNKTFQLVIHAVCLTIMFKELKMFQLTTFQLLFAYLVGFIILQAFQLMDCANGVVGAMGLSILFSFLLMDPGNWNIGASNPYLYLVFALLVFAFFNFRVKAMAFGGTIGRTSLAFILLFFTFKFMTGNNGFSIESLGELKPAGLSMSFVILFFSVFLLEYFYLVAKRISAAKSPLQMEREHYFFDLKNKLGVPPIGVSLVYALIQFSINLLLILFYA